MLGMLGRVALLAGEQSSGINAVTDALKTGMGEVSTQALTAVGAVIPYAIPIMGGMTVISLGYRVFKKFGK